MAKITINRLEQLAGYYLPMSIYIDSVKMFKINPGDTQSFEVSPGTHSIKIKMLLEYSTEYKCTVDTNENLELITYASYDNLINTLLFNTIKITPKESFNHNTIHNVHKSVLAGISVLLSSTLLILATIIPDFLSDTNYHNLIFALGVSGLIGSLFLFKNNTIHAKSLKFVVYLLLSATLITFFVGNTYVISQLGYYLFNLVGFFLLLTTIYIYRINRKITLH
jgi:hypothetical protein